MGRNWSSYIPALCMTLIFLCESIGAAGQKKPRPSNLISFPTQETIMVQSVPAASKPQKTVRKATQSIIPQISIECPDTVVQNDTFTVVYHLKANGWSKAHISNSKVFVQKENKTARGTQMLKRAVTYESRAPGRFDIPAFVVVDVNGMTYTRTRTIEVLPNPQYAEEYTAGYQWLRTCLENSDYRDSLCLELYKRSDDWVLLNDVNRKAFVLVASSSYWSKGIKPILAWSCENAYSFSEGNGNKDVILENYTNQLRESMAEGVNDYSLSLPYRRKHQKCAPILGDIRWGQGTPYNLEMPLDARGKRVPVGCVPVATSQVLKYFQSDVQLHTSVYYREINGEVYSITFDDWHPDWKLMKGHYEQGETSASDVSLVMLMIGMGLNARYGRDATSAHFRNIKPLLCYNFGYSPMMRTIDNQPDSIIYSMIYSDLDEGHPCIVSWDGHAFVVDGYDTGYLHYNLGWGGVCNGWYQSVLCPSASRTTEGLLRSAVVNINPRRDTLRKEVYVKKAGTLASLLTEEEQRSVTHLRVSGKINGDDIRLLRKMAGCPQEENKIDSQWGNMTSLDMSDAVIVKSKNPYYSRRSTFTWTHTTSGDGGRIYTSQYDLSQTITSAEWSRFCATIGATQEGVRYTYDKHTGVVTAHLMTENNKLGYSLFERSEALESIVLPSSVTHIKNGALVNCPLLHKLIIPESVKLVEKNAITYCQSLETVKILSPGTICNKTNFEQCSPGFKCIK